jgi:replicative DNA helicase
MKHEHDPLLLSAVLHGADPRDAEHVTPESFYIERNSVIWRTMIELANQGSQISPATVATQSGHPESLEYLERLQANHVDPDQIHEYAAKVADGALRRVIAKVGHEINAAAGTDRDVADVYDTALGLLEALPKHVAYRDNPPRIPAPYRDGGSFIFDIPDKIPAIWGAGQDVLWAEGEALMIVGSSGVGKTTLTGQVVRGLLFGGDVLGLPVKQLDGPVLYLAMDRPKQIARSLARHFSPSERDHVADNLIIWPGPPQMDLAKYPATLVEMCKKVNAAAVVVDSLKDAAIGLSEDAVGAGYNNARQQALAAGIEVLELHHQVKRGPNGEAPTSLADVYGSAWLTGGAGSVALLSGVAGDTIVGFSHLKQPAETVGPFKVLHDHPRGISSVHNTADPLHMAEAAGPEGITVTDFARALYDSEKPSKNEIEKARRRLDSLVKKSLLDKGERPVEGGGKPTSVYLQKQSRKQSRTIFDETNHDDGNQSR